MQYTERFATWEEVDELLKDVQAHLNVSPLIYGLDETRAALAELGDCDEFRELVFAVSHPRWENDVLEKKLVFLARIDREKVVEAMANAMNPRG